MFPCRDAAAPLAWLRCARSPPTPEVGSLSIFLRSFKIGLVPIGVLNESWHVLGLAVLELEEEREALEFLEVAEVEKAEDPTPSGPSAHEVSIH